ncbi:16820_t:CDS:2, partial [Racocetra persica]
IEAPLLYLIISTLILALTHFNGRFNSSDSIYDNETEVNLHNNDKTKSRLNITIVICLLHVCLDVLQNSYELDCICWLIVWMYATLLALILKNNSQQYGFLHIRNHLNILYLLSMFYVIKNLHLDHLKIEMLVNTKETKLCHE